jgi:type II secretory pathway component PulF
MPRYSYVALDCTGDEICDIVNETTREHLVASLESQGLAVQTIAEVTDADDLDRMAAEEACHAETPGQHALIVARVNRSFDMSVDKSIDSSIDEAVVPQRELSSRELLRLAQLDSVQACTGHGERCLGLLEPLLVGRVTFQDAVAQLASARLGGRVGRTFDLMAAKVERFHSLIDLLEEHRAVLGDVAIEYLRLGESNFGITESLRRYRRMRQSQRDFAGLRFRAEFRSITRRFAFTFAGAQELSGDVVRSMRCAAIETRRPLRVRLAYGIRRVAEGEPLGSSLPQRALFWAGFEPRFVRLIGAAEDLSLLPEVLRAAAAA